MLIARTRPELAAAIAPLTARQLVPTMGALHDGHLALVRAARTAGPVIASIFVNPLQFAPHEDLQRYPRDEAGDVAALAQAGCAVAFLPAAAEIYPPGDATTIDVAGPALGFEGARRPTHFCGVATVVARLFGLVRPESAWFGEKDWQQVQVIRRMTADLCLGVTVRAVPTVREPDGLALSSRNRFLTQAERALAPALARACGTAVAALRDGGDAGVVLADGRLALTALGFEVDYFALVDADTLLPVERRVGSARLIAAAQLGSVRLLDNFPV